MYEKFCLFLITPGLTSNESFKLLTFFEQNSWLAVSCRLPQSRDYDDI